MQQGEGLGVSLFSRRAGGSRKLRRRLDGDMRAVGELAEQYAGVAGDGTFDLLAFAIQAFALGSTADVDFLISHGVDGSEFFMRELKPNWRNLTREERAAKIASFVRFVNLLDASDQTDDVAATERLAELRATVRTKIVLLACAYDVTYDDHYCRLIARNPQRFGEYELPSALART
jgi:hypothetical protein